MESVDSLEGFYVLFKWLQLVIDVGMIPDFLGLCSH